MTEESKIRLIELFVPIGTKRIFFKSMKWKEQEPTKFETSSGMVNSCQIKTEKVFPSQEITQELRILASP